MTDPPSLPPSGTVTTPTCWHTSKVSSFPPNNYCSQPIKAPCGRRHSMQCNAIGTQLNATHLHSGMKCKRNAIRYTAIEMQCNWMRCAGGSAGVLVGIRPRHRRDPGLERVDPGARAQAQHRGLRPPRRGLGHSPVQVDIQGRPRGRTAPGKVSCGCVWVHSTGTRERRKHVNYAAGGLPGGGRPAEIRFANGTFCESVLQQAHDMIHDT